jgi:hypothetical protein
MSNERNEDVRWELAAAALRKAKSGVAQHFVL